MKILLFTFILSLGMINLDSSSTESKVYICVSPSASKYHFQKGCRGLNNCKHTIKQVTISEAQKLGYKICGWED